MKIGKGLKKYKIAYVTGILGILLCTSACGKQEQEQVEIPMVQDAYSVKCTIEESTDFAYEIEYHVPKITIDCDGAKQLNNQILEDCAEAKEPESIEDYYAAWEKVSYDTYLYKDYLCVVLEMKATAGDYTTYKTYNLNTATGKIATNVELAGAAGMKESELPDLLRKTAIYEYDQMMMETLTSDYMKEEEDTIFKQDVYLDLIKARFRTMEELSKNIENTPLYLTDEGELKTIIPIQMLAGSGESNRPLACKRQNAYQNLDFSFEDGIFISYHDGKMTVRIEENDWSQNAFYNSELEYGKEYPVKGVFKDYVQGEMMAIMYGDFAIPVFISDDQTIAYLNIYECAQSGTFCLTEMAYVPEYIATFNEENRQTIDAALSHYIFEQYDGYSKRMMDLYDIEGCSLENELTAEDGSVVTSYKYMGFDTEDPGLFLYQESDAEGNFYPYQGYITYMGMDEKGLYVSFCVDNWENNSFKKGMFRTKREYEWDEQEKDYLSYIEYHYISGDNLFPDEDGIIKLYISMG